MTSICLIIIAWVMSLPLWASITITVLASVSFLASCLQWALGILKFGKRN